MKNFKKITGIPILILIVMLSVFNSCKKDERKPPLIVFKTGGNYISSDDSVAKGTTITVGIKADKTEDELSTLNVSYAYDGASSTISKDNFSIPSKENEHYQKDYAITTRNQAGREKWSFTITDKDGNIANLILVLTVY